MSSAGLSQALGKYSQQRRERTQKRNAFKSRIAALSQTTVSQPHHSPLIQDITQPQPNSSQLSDNHLHLNHKEHQTEQSMQPLVGEQSELQLLLQQNKRLFNETVELENAERDTLVSYRKIIHEIRDKYLFEVEKMKSGADQRTRELHDKALSLRLQAEAASKKNEELQKANQTLRNQIKDGNSTIGKQITSIKQAYAAKLEEVQKIFNSSNEKIQTFEKQFNQDQLVQNTISNQQFLANLEISAKQAEQAQGLIEEYKNLVGGKTEILDQLKTNNKMKEEQLKKLTSIEIRMKDIARRITEDKVVLMKENEKIVEELKEIKQVVVAKQ